MDRSAQKSFSQFFTFQWSLLLFSWAIKLSGDPVEEGSNQHINSLRNWLSLESVRNNRDGCVWWRWIKEPQSLDIVYFWFYSWLVLSCPLNQSSEGLNVWHKVACSKGTSVESICSLDHWKILEDHWASPVRPILAKIHLEFTNELFHSPLVVKPQ